MLVAVNAMQNDPSVLRLVKKCCGSQDSVRPYSYLFFSDMEVPAVSLRNTR
jgi:hypothetical protein